MGDRHGPSLLPTPPVCHKPGLTEEEAEDSDCCRSLPPPYTSLANKHEWTLISSGTCLCHLARVCVWEALSPGWAPVACLLPAPPPSSSHDSALGISLCVGVSSLDLPPHIPSPLWWGGGLGSEGNRCPQRIEQRVFSATLQTSPFPHLPCHCPATPGWLPRGGSREPHEPQVSEFQGGRSGCTGAQMGRGENTGHTGWGVGRLW